MSERPLTQEQREALVAVIRSERTEMQQQLQGLEIGTPDRDQRPLPYGNHAESGSDECAQDEIITARHRLNANIGVLRENERRLSSPEFTGRCTCSCGCGTYIGYERIAALISTSIVTECITCASGECSKGQGQRGK
jgi:hypothetical protein